MKRIVGICFFALLAGTTLLAAARGLPPEQGEIPGDPIAGARIYDNWILALDKLPPEGNHPLWDNQDSNTRSGVVTWRCAECHGWDYKGVDGAYGPYSNHYTGFTGLGDAVGASQEQVVAWLDGTVNLDHDFLRYTNSPALNDLAAFLRTRQIDTDLIIDPDTGVAFGDRRVGLNIYNDTCAACHGDTGDQINFGNAQNPLYLGDLAVADPWQSLHKIRFGTPTSERMPAYEDEDWSLSMMADVLAYTQTLPRGNPDFAILGTGPVIDVEGQGQIEPIIYGAFAILLVVAISLGWDLYVQRKPAPVKPGKSMRRK
ncbi:MAG: c-type cytochrome [Chloroflexi bacterium]|nr:c-type cytochrome [Chloroflexota bacterium]